MNYLLRVTEEQKCVYYPHMEHSTYTVIIPTLNEEACLPRLLESLVCQTMRDFEVIVVDGGSVDRTVAIARSFASKLRLTVRSLDRASLPAQRNLGAREANSTWLVFVDADSELLPYFFVRLSAFIQETNSQFVTTWFRPDSDSASDALVTLLMNMVYEVSLRMNRPVSPGPLTCITKRAFDAAGGYDETRKWGEDYDFSMKVKKIGVSLSVLRETLYRVSLRRFRREKKGKLLGMYARIIASILFTGNAPRYVSGYIMGGGMYTKSDRGGKIQALEAFERKIKHLVREMME